MPVSRNPPYVAVAIAPDRYTYELIKKYKDFSVNILELKDVKKLHFMGSVSGKELPDKIEKAGLSICNPYAIKSITLCESVATAECTLEKVVPCGDHDIFVGRVVKVYGMEYFIKLPDIEKYESILHIGMNYYTTTIKKKIVV